MDQNSEIYLCLLQECGPNYIYLILIIIILFEDSIAWYHNTINSFPFLLDNNLRIKCLVNPEFHPTLVYHSVFKLNSWYIFKWLFFQIYTKQLRSCSWIYHLLYHFLHKIIPISHSFQEKVQGAVCHLRQNISIRIVPRIRNGTFKLLYICAPTIERSFLKLGHSPSSCLAGLSLKR